MLPQFLCVMLILPYVQLDFLLSYGPALNYMGKNLYGMILYVKTSFLLEMEGHF